MSARLVEAERFLGLYFAPGPQQDMAVLVLDGLSRLRGELRDLRDAEVERPREMFANELRGANETVRRLQEENDDLRDRLAEFERSRRGEAA